MTQYRYVIAFTDGNVEEDVIRAHSYIEAMRCLHKRCNQLIHIQHKTIRQTLLG